MYYLKSSLKYVFFSFWWYLFLGLGLGWGCLFFNFKVNYVVNVVKYYWFVSDYVNRVLLFIKVEFIEIVIYFFYSFLLMLILLKNINFFWKNLLIVLCRKVLILVLL